MDGRSIIEPLLGIMSVIGPVSFVLAIVATVSAIATVAPLFVPGIASFMYQRFRSTLGLLPKRKKTWGTIYDSNTKRPIPFAKVQLLDHNKRLLETHIADRQGRYGFLINPENVSAESMEVYILPSQTDYIFPSKVAISIDTFVYNNLYYGHLIGVNQKDLINFDIPMAPMKVSPAPLLVKSPSVTLGASVAVIADTAFWLGLLIVPLNFILVTNPFTFGVLCLFSGTASLRVFGISEYPFGVVKDGITGLPMSFALITLNDRIGKRLGFTVSDEQGRYFIVTDSGSYEITVCTSARIQPMRQGTFIIEAKKGWITKELTV